MAKYHFGRDEFIYEWRMPDGNACRVKLYGVTAAEAEQAARSCGWPGRQELGA